MTDTYHVVLLVENALTDGDAARIRSLHEGLEEPVVYDILLPVEDAAAKIEAAMGGLGAGEFGAPALALESVDVDAVQADAHQRAQSELQASITALRDAGATVEGQLVDDPIPALAAKVKQVDGREAIILTAPHVVAEFFHVDWTHQARHALGVPVLHLIERENFDEQAGEGEGAHLF